MDIIAQLLVNSLIAGALYSLLALGFNLLYSTVRFFDVAYGTVGLVATYIVLCIARISNLPVLLSSLIAILAAGVLNYFIYTVVYKPLRARKASNTVMLVAAFGVFSVLQAVLAMLFSSQFFSLRSSSSVFRISSASITDVQILTLVLSLIIPLVLWSVLKGTTFGRATRAVSDNEEVANIVGINSSSIIARVFLISGCLSGLAALMAGFDRGVEPYMGLALLLKAIVASIVGGIGYVWGGVLGGFFLGFAENLGSWYLPSEWKDTIAFVILVIFLLFRPKGILKK
jgi:branched-chain amino acid transport system permease protein